MSTISTMKKAKVDVMWAALGLLILLLAQAPGQGFQDYADNAAPATGDLLLVQDISDLTDGVNGTTKKQTFGVLRDWYFASPTMTGTLTVPTVTLSGTGTLNGLDAIDATTEATLEGVLDLQDLQGAVTDAQVPDTITVDLATLATTATTANAGDSATAFFAAGSIEDARIPDDITIDRTTVDAVTWSDGANASNIWTFDVSGTDHTMTAGSGAMTFSGNVGIGTSSPASALDIGSGTLTLAGATIASNGIDPNNGITITPEGTGGMSLASGDLTLSNGDITLSTASSAIKFVNSALTIKKRASSLFLENGNNSHPIELSQSAGGAVHIVAAQGAGPPTIGFTEARGDTSATVKIEGSDTSQSMTFITNNVDALTLDFYQNASFAGIISGNDDALTLGVGVTTFATASNFQTITGDGGANTVATITGGQVGQTLTLLFVDGLVTITDDNTHPYDSVDLSAAFTSADDTTLTLIYNGTSWYETSRSVN